MALEFAVFGASLSELPMVMVKRIVSVKRISESAERRTVIWARERSFIV